MKHKDLTVVKSATMDLKGAHCASCAYTIEHLGRKIKGVKDVHVETGKQEIRVSYDGNPGSLERIVEIVKYLGYDASIRWMDIDA